MNATIRKIASGSPAAKTIIAAGDILRRINGQAITDVLDYKFCSYDECLMLELVDAHGKLKLVRLRKPEGADIGLEFETFLMDKERSCANKCIFCFIDQNPKGMRNTIYYKDDDVRLSFLQGNYITLTNLSQDDVERIIKLHISPINVSIHTLNPVLRSSMLGNKNGGAAIDALRKLAQAGITLNCQIVCCPGYNDGEELSRTIEGLVALGSSINSVSVVPVGLTQHRAALTEIEPVGYALAREIVNTVNHYGAQCMNSRGSRVFFCADELYMKAGLLLPSDEFYEGYPQLENGVGMMRLLITEFEEALAQITSNQLQMRDEEKSSLAEFSVATGVLAQRYLTKLLRMAAKKYDTISGSVYGIKNDFFGESITVSGLVTGADLITQLRGKKLGSRLLIPQNMLRFGEHTFLDDVKVSDVSEALGVPVRIVKQNGVDLLHAFLGLMV